MKLLGRYSISSAIGALLTYLFLISIVILAVTIIALIFGLIDPRGVQLFSSVRVELQSQEPLLAIESHQGWIEQLRLTPSTQIQAASTNRWIAFGHTGMVTLLAFALFYILLQLRFFFESLTHGHPLVPENAKRLKRIAWTLIIGNILIPILNLWETHRLKDAVSLQNMTLQITPAAIVDLVGPHLWNGIFIGFILLVIAEVLRLGAKLKEDQDLTV